MINEISNFFKKKQIYLNNKFFPHIVLDDFLENEIAEKVNNEIENIADDSDPYFNFNVKKFAINDREKLKANTVNLIDFLNSEKFIKQLENLTGLKGLIPDPRLEGGGIHYVKSGGYLRVHSDFQSHIINSNWSRTLNLLLYFNKDWKSDYNGSIELWSADMNEKITYEPIFNRALLFYTGKNSYHGHPKKLTTPTNIFRKSIALYYYIDKKKHLKLSETNFVPLPKDDTFTKFLMKLDQLLLRVFSFLKRKQIVNDKTYTKIIKKITKK